MWHVPADDAVRADPRAGLDDDAFVDEAGRLDDGAFLDPGLGRHARGPRRGGERGRLVTAVHDVAVHLHVFFRCADVDPVSAIHVRDERLAALDQRRKKAPLDRPRRVFRDPIEGVRLEHVDPRVDRVAGDLVGFGLFDEAQDVALRVGLDQPVGGGIRDRRQHDRRLRPALAMQPDDGAEIDLRSARRR